MDYEDKVFIYLKNELKDGEKVLITSLTNEPKTLINAVKFLIDCKYVTNIEFTNDYKYIRKQWPLKTKHNPFRKLERK